MSKIGQNAIRKPSAHRTGASRRARGADQRRRCRTFGSRRNAGPGASSLDRRQLIGARAADERYYSNLIEGHNTRPKDIERALAGQFDTDAQRRSLQLEAAAHVRVQAEVDRLAADGRLPEPASPDFIRWLHQSFYQDVPENMLQIGVDGNACLMVPGECRSVPQHDVVVGRHMPPSSDRVPDFMRYFAELMAPASGRGGSGRSLEASPEVSKAAANIKS